MVSNSFRFGVFLLIGLFAFGVGGCGKKKMAMTDPVATVMETPGIRTVVIPKQRQDVTVVVTPCTAAQVQQPTAERKPPGSNEVVVPKGGLTQTVAVPPCPEKPSQGPANTVLVTPGGTGSAQQETPPQDQLVLPDNSDATTIIIPPCTTGPKASKKRTLAFPATTKKKSVTAPPCTVQAPA